MADFDPIEGLKTAFLAGVGAVALGAEKSQELVSDLVKKGELTVEQGKDLNQELTRKAKEVVDNASDAALRARLERMSAEERAAFVAKVGDIASDLDSAAVKVEVEAEDASDEDGAPEAAAE